MSPDSLTAAALPKGVICPTVKRHTAYLNILLTFNVTLNTRTRVGLHNVIPNKVRIWDLIVYLVSGVWGVWEQTARLWRSGCVADRPPSEPAQHALWDQTQSGKQMLKNKQIHSKWCVSSCFPLKHLCFMIFYATSNKIKNEPLTDWELEKSCIMFSHCMCYTISKFQRWSKTTRTHIHWLPGWPWDKGCVHILRWRQTLIAQPTSLHNRSAFHGSWDSPTQD